MGQDAGSIRQEIEETRGRMSDTVDQLASKAHVGERIKESVADKRDRLMHQMQGTADRVDRATPDAADVKQGARHAAGVAQENPIGLAVGGLAAGFLAGMLLPSTRIEDERIGEISDEVKGRAQEKGQEALDRGREVGAQAVDAARESTQEAIDATKEAAETARDSAQDAAEEVTETVKAGGRDQVEEMRSNSS